MQKMLFNQADIPRSINWKLMKAKCKSQISGYNNVYPKQLLYSKSFTDS